MKTILLIDDESSIRTLMEELVTDWGYNFLEAAKAMDGIKMLDKHDIDLIILDIQMPNMNGLDTVRIIRELKHDIPIYIMSAFTNYRDKVKELDVSGFIPKPFDETELQEIIYDAIGL